MHESHSGQDAPAPSEALYRLIIESIEDFSVATTDAQGLFTSWNTGAERIFGYRREEILGKPSALLFTPEDRERHAPEQELELARTLGKAADERWHLRKDGSRFWANGVTTALRDGAGRLIGFAKVARDLTGKKLAADALQAVLKVLPVGVFIADPSGQLLEANPAAHTLWGAGMPLSGKPESYDQFKAWWPETGHRVEAHEWGLARAIQSGEISGPEEMEIETFTGEHKTILNYARPIHDAAGQITGAVAVTVDFTEQKRAREMALKLAREEAARTEAEAAHRRMEALLQEQRRLTAILEATPDLVGTFDTEGRLLYLNRAGRRMLGMNEEQLSRKTLVDVHPGWAASLLLREGIPSAIREGAWSGETAVVCQQGKELPISQVIIAHRQPGGAVEYLSTIARDIEERKRTEEAQHFLSEASRTFAGTLEHQAILESLTRLAVSRLADGCITYWVGKDGKARPVTAAHPGKDGGKLLERLRALPSEGDLPLGISRVLRVGEPERVSEVTEAWLRAISRNDEHFHLLRELAPTSVMLVPLCFRERILGALFLASQRRGRHYGPADLALAEELASRAGLAIENARLYHESTRATRARDEVLAIVSHDLRNPLSTISMSGRLLLEKMPPDKPRERKHLEIIQRSAERMNRLIQDLLDVARMEAGHLSVERRREEVAPLVHDALELQRTLAEEKGIQLEASVADALPAVEVDRGRLLQVLQNLMGNALRFTPEGGRISLKAWQVDQEVYLSVTDTGPGIAQESLPHLFEPFWQARRTEGAGLGLAIVKGIVQAHGGRIWVESQLGHGTTFVFTVPVLAGVTAEDHPLPH